MSLAVELGQVFEQVLMQAGRRDLVDLFRTAYPMDKEPVDIRDEEAARFLQVVNRRCTHGVDLFLAAQNALPDLSANPRIGASDEGVIREALDQLHLWVVETVGPIGNSDAAALETAYQQGILIVHTPLSVSLPHPDLLHAGEAESIQLAIELEAEWLLMDDLGARHIAQQDLTAATRSTGY